jgi:hypothetical protein
MQNTSGVNPKSLTGLAKSQTNQKIKISNVPRQLTLCSLRGLCFEFCSFGFVWDLEFCA